jgi:hypothetical protein
MAISVSEIHSRLQPYLSVHLKEEVVDLLIDTDYLRIMNDVANDLNDRGFLNMERWANTGGSVTAEDSGYTNYLMQGEIQNILSFYYEDSDWETQRYSYTADRVILKDSAADVDMDIRYLRKCEDVSLTTDEIDLPEAVLVDYMELLKTRLRIDYGNLTKTDYETALEYYAEKASRKVNGPKPKVDGVHRHWFYDDDDEQYNITSQYIGIENFVADVSGNYSFIE